MPKPMHQPIRPNLLFLFISLLLTTTFCFAQDQITVETIAGKKISGILQELDSAGNLIGEGFDGVNIEQVLSIATGKAATKPASATRLGLVGGGELFVSAPTVDGESIGFEPTAIGLDAISLQSVRSIVFKDSDQIREAIAQPATDKDTVIVARDSSLARVAGVLESLNGEKLQLNFKGKSRPIKLEKVAAVVIADLGLNPPQGTIVTASFSDGSTIKGALTGIDNANVMLELTGKQQIRIARKFLVRIDVASDSIAYLSTLEPVEVQQRAQFVVDRPWQRNRSIEGNPIRLLVPVDGSEPMGANQIKSFGNGIGTSSFSRLVFANTNEFSRFVATVGIDAETEGRGDCEMRVEGDGISLWSQRIRGGDAAVDVDVDISGISQIALIVEPGEQFDLADHADWAQARFLKTE